VLYLLIRRIDLARAFLGAALQFRRHVAQLVRMMLADQLAVGTLDLGRARAACDAKDRIRVLACGCRARLSLRALAA